MAIQQPDRVEAMVLMSGGSYFPESGREWARGLTIENLDDQLGEGAFDKLQAIHAQPDMKIPELLKMAKAYANDKGQFKKGILLNTCP